jgi:hypothetical protein
MKVSVRKLYGKIYHEQRQTATRRNALFQVLSAT